MTLFRSMKPAAGATTRTTTRASAANCPTVPMPVGVTLLCLQYVADFLCLVTGREAPFADAGEVKA